MGQPNEPQLTLVSTTDPIAAVQAALGVTPEAAAAAVAAAPATVPVTEPATVPAVVPPVAEPVVTPPVVEPAAVVAEPVVAAEPVKPVKGAKEKGNSLQGRIDELVRERDTARGLTAAHEAELVALRAKVSELAGPTTPKVETPATEEAPKPKVEDFPDYDAYVEASIQYHAKKIAADQVREALAAQATTTAQTQQQQAVTEIIAQHETRVAAAKDRYEDFDEVVGQPGITISTVMRDSIMISEVGPDVAYYLANHPEEREKLAAMGNSPAAIRAMGKLEQKVETEMAAKGSPAASVPVSTPAVSTPVVEPVAKPAVAAPAATRAPDPLPAPGGGSVVTTVRPDQMSFSDYKKWRAENQAARRA